MGVLLILNLRNGVPPRSLIAAAEPDEGLALFLELREAVALLRVSLKQATKQGDALWGHANAFWESDSLALDVSQEVNVINAVEGRFPRNHFEKYGARAPEVGVARIRVLA